MLRNQPLIGFLASLLFVCSLSGTVTAENRSLALAKELVKVDGVDAVFGKMVEMTVQQSEAALRTQHPHIKPEALEKYTTYLSEELLSEKPGLIQAIAELYPQHFTEQEMEQLLVFYHTDLGKKTVTAAVQMQDQIVPLSMQWSVTAAVRAGQRAHERLKEEGIKL